MKMGTVKCEGCSQNSVRNIHNKCVYCGHQFSPEHHVSDSERAERLAQIEATNERLKNEIEIEKEREKLRQELARWQSGYL